MTAVSLIFRPRVVPELPQEIWLKIVSTAALVMKLSRVNSQFYSTFMKPDIWKHLLLVDFAFYDEASPPSTVFLDQERLDCIAAIYKNTLFTNKESWDDYTNACLAFIEERGGTIPYEQQDEMERAGFKVARQNQWEKHIAPTFLPMMYEKIPTVQDNCYYAFYKQTYLEATCHLTSETDRGSRCLRFI